MSTVHYPKSKPHPNAGVGECDTTTWPEGHDTSYPAGGVQDCDYNGDKSKTVHLAGGEGGKTKRDYPKKARDFGTVISKGT